MHQRSCSRLIASVLGACALSLAALANNPGPDVIVGDLIDTYPYGSASVGGVPHSAFDIGTVSCNVGNVNLQWVQNTNQHPVIAQNIYRLKNGRLEQIGASWVKHGFYAFDFDLCSTCNGQYGTVLGVGCSDPYDFRLNGQQGSLGPRSEINAATGGFIYNPAAWPPYSGTDVLARRIRIANDEIDPAQNPGALYFAEGLYITPDDAQAGNSWNNASYRRMRFSPADPPQPEGFVSTFLSPELTPLDETHRTRPAIWAWHDVGGGVDSSGQPIADPNVRIQPIDIPGDGRIFIAHKVTDNGNGTWRYEYAVMNLTSDRSGASLVIPIPTGTSITAPGFRDVPPHSGEPYDSTDWNYAKSATTVSWTCPQTYAQSVNANALRWGTMYNFWFNSAAAPGEGSAKIDLFKPGAGAYSGLTAVAVKLRTPGGANTALAPFNNACAQPTPVHSGPNGFTTLNATTDGPDACDSTTPGTGAIASDVWFTYTYTPFADTCPGDIVIDTCGTDFDAKLAVYAGAACPTAPGTAIACSDDGASCTPGAAQVSFPATPGATYLIRVGSLSSQTGNGLLNITVPFCIPAPGACCFSNGLCATVQGPHNCAGGAWQGSDTLCTPTNPCTPSGPPPNDLCANAIPVADTAPPISAPPVSATTVLATTDGAPVCIFGSQGTNNVWYAYTPALSESVTIDTCSAPASGLLFDTILNIYDGCGGTAVACSDDALGCGSLSSITTPLSAHTRYLISVSGYFNATGDFVLRVAGGQGQIGPTTGACCRGSICVLAAAAECAATGERFAGAGIACNASLQIQTPCCRADFDQSGTVSIDDLFLYLNAWFTGAPAAAITSGGTAAPAIDDLFLFLNAWFTGC